MSFSVKKFDYNGFFVSIDEALAPFTAEFMSWSDNDPGIALCKCSDGKERLIPFCALVGFVNERKSYPEQVIKGERAIFGKPSSSE